MAYLALYRKYRPSSFDGVVGQEKIIKVISNAIVNNRVSHAYLFSGPRGTGKTTTAKILAKMVNCENLVDCKPCEECESCKNILNSSDIVEIDAASNNGVDEIREIRDKVNLVPSVCKYKVYIIDEVHMLTTQAFNALLKTLEEPPGHVIFILATTEFHKIPLTISSRCQKFQFTKIDDFDIVKRLKKIAEMENISIEEDALYEIARLSDGGLRDAINLLDQLTAYQSETIKLDDVYKISGSVSYIELFNLLINILNNNTNDIISFVEDINKNGKNIARFVEEIIIFLKDVLIYKSTNVVTNIGEKNDKIKEISSRISEDKLFNYINILNDLLSRIKITNYPSILLIVELLKMSNENYNSTDKAVVVEKKYVNKLENNLNVDTNSIKNDSTETQKFNNSLSDDKIKIRINNALAKAEKNILLDIKKDWNNISNYLLDDRYSSIVGLLTDVNPVVASSDYLILECRYNSAVDRLNQLEESISDFLFELCKNKYKIVAISTDEWIKVREKYVNDRKKGIIYNVQLEDEEVQNNKKNDSSLEKLVELLGEDIIEYR